MNSAQLNFACYFCRINREADKHVDRTLDFHIPLYSFTFFALSDILPFRLNCYVFGKRDGYSLVKRGSVTIPGCVEALIYLEQLLEQLHWNYRTGTDL